MTPQLLLLGFLLLSVKHFVVDFPLQKPRHYLNKGTYGHPGGIEHALQHTIGTLFVIMSITGEWKLALAAAYFDGVIHYHVDWLKMNLNSLWGLRPDNSEKFWWLLGADQLAHYVTYVIILAFLI